MLSEEFERTAFDGKRLYFQLWQTEQDVKGVVCLEHGLGEHCNRYAAWNQKLNKAGYSVITFDLRGHGKSEGQRGHISSFNDYIEDTDLLLKEARSRFPGIPIFLYGHSMGAIIIWDYVLMKKPELSGVILSALDYRNALEEQKVKVLLSRVLGSIVPTMSMSSGLNPHDISRDQEVVSRYINDPLVHDKVSLGWAKSALVAVEWSLAHTGEWTLPVLLMHGENDKIGYVIGSQQFADKVNCDCTLKVWSGLSHEIHNEPEKDMVFDFLQKWLDEHIVSAKH